MNSAKISYDDAMVKEANSTNEGRSSGIFRLQKDNDHSVIPTTNENDQLIPEMSKNDKFIPTMISGGIAGCVSKTAMAPLSRLTILYQVDSAINAPSSSSSISSNLLYESNRTLNLSQLIRKTVHEEGFLSLWKGNLTSVIHRFPYSAINFAVYELTKEYCKKAYNSNETVSMRLIGGALGGASACIACYPLDIVRTRLTISRADTMNYATPSTRLISFQESSILRTIRVILEKEGLAGLYRGLLVSLSVCVPNLAVGFATYGTVKETILQSNFSFLKNDSGLNAFGALIGGASSGLVSSMLVFPADVIRRRMQVRGLKAIENNNTRNPISISNEISSLWRSEGLRGFYRGLTPELLKVIPSVGLTFSIYEMVLHLLAD